MPYDPQLADRLRHSLPARPDLVEKGMFGGLAILVGGRMVLGIVGEELMVRVGREEYERTLRLPDARPMDFTGRPMRGFVFVGSAGLRSEKMLATWVRRGLAQAPDPTGPSPRRATSPPAAPHRGRGG